MRGLKGLGSQMSCESDPGTRLQLSVLWKVLFWQLLGLCYSCDVSVTQSALPAAIKAAVI